MIVSWTLLIFVKIGYGAGFTSVDSYASEQYCQLASEKIKSDFDKQSNASFIMTSCVKVVSNGL